MTEEARLAGFIAAYDPAVAALATEAITRLRGRLPGAEVLVYDNYNALAVGFGPSGRTSDAVLSIAVWPRWVSLFFLKDGARLDDPDGLLKGAGTKARHLVLSAASDLDRPSVRALIDQALDLADPPIPLAGEGRLIIKSVSAKRRPRRPGTDG